jgi:prepilin-type N-terminal cleavage/methylation domain-containing protein/prepilin-type processing-associated H-X9-DG protein
MKRKGFTLIELLVVIAIIAILAAILFPVFARARAKAMQAACLSNVKQIMLAANAYTTDYDGRYPPPGGTFLSWTQGQNSADMETLLAPYMKNMQIWVCPSQTPAVQTAVLAPNYAVAYTHLIDDYVWNNWNNGRDWDQEGPLGVTQSDITQAGTCILVGDAYCSTYGPLVEANAVANWNTLDIGLTAEPPYWPYTQWVANCVFEGVHSDMANFAFVDGHAKSLSMTLFAGCNYGYPSAGHPGYGSLMWCSFPQGPNSNN